MSSSEKESIYDSCESLDESESEKQTNESNIDSRRFLIGQQAKQIDEQLSKIENETIQGYRSKKSRPSESSNVSSTQTQTLIDKWILTIKGRYEHVFEVDQDDVRSLVIQVVKSCFTDCQSDNPESIVDNKIKNFLNEISKPEQRSKMMRRALERFDEENYKLDTTQKVINPEIIKQVDALLTETKSSDELEQTREIRKKVLSKEKNKFQLYELFLSEELATLNSLVFNRIDNEFTNPSISKLSKPLPKDAHFDIIKSIFNELNRAEERFGNTNHLSELNSAVLATVIGLENYFPQISDRHIRYEEILKHLLACFSGCEINLDEMKIVISLRKSIFDRQWENFAKEKLQRNDNLSQSEKTVIEILTNCFSKNNEVKIDLLELEYYISSLVEMEKIKNLYSIVDALSTYSTSARPLFSSILNMAERREMIELSRKFRELTENQREEYRKVIEAKNSIVDEFSMSCGALNQAEREKNIAMIKHFLDRLDRLLAEINGEDISCSERMSVLNELKRKANSENFTIENRVAEAINSRIFATTMRQPLLIDSISENIEGILKKTRSDGEYKRVDRIGQVIMLVDVYDNFGRVKKDQAREVFFKNRTVLVNHSDEGQAAADEFYRLSNDLNLLTADSNEHSRSLRDYSDELLVEFKKFKLTQFKKAIVEFNKNRTTKNFIQVSRGLIYYLTLGADICANQHEVLKFLDIYNKTVEKLVFINKEDQDIISEIRVALDMYFEGFQGQTLDKQSSELSQSLRGVLRFKTYKDADFNLLNEMQNEFKPEMSKNSYFFNELNEILNEKLSEIVWLRGLRKQLDQSPHVFFQDLNKLVDKQIPTGLKNVNKNSIETIKKYLEKQRGDTTEKWEEKLVDSIISQPETKQDAHTLEKLSAFIHRNSEKFSLEFLKKQVLESNLGDFSINICREYALKLLKEKQASFDEKLKEGGDIIWPQLKQAVMRAFEILDVDFSSTKKISFEKFLDYLNELFDVVPKEAKESFNSASIYEKEIKFITARINNSDVQTEVDSSTSGGANQTVFDKYPSLKEEEKVVFLKLLLFMPDRFYTREIKDAYKNLVIMAKSSYESELVKNIKNSSRDEMKELIRMHVVRYVLAFLEQEADLIGDNDQTDKKSWMSEIRESIVRAFDKMPTSEFFQCSIPWLEHQQNPGENFVLKICREKIAKGGKNSQNRFDYVPMLLYDNEREHLKAILGYEKNGCVSDDLIKELQANCSQSDSKFNEKLSKIFNDSPIIMWSEEMIELRLRRVMGLMPRLQVQDHGTTSKLTNILTAYRYFHEQHGPRFLAHSLNTLDLLCSNIDKFTSVEELKQSIYSIVNATKLTEVDELIKSSQKFTIGLDLIFRQIDVSRDKKLKNDMEILKLALSTRPFAEITHFCQLLVAKTREKLNIDDLSQIIDLIIKSRAYDNTEMVTFLRDNDMSLWPARLKKQVLLNEFDLITSLHKLRLSVREKQNAVDVLHRIGEEKGVALQETLMIKLKDLDKNEPISMKKITLVLNKILHTPFDTSRLALLGVNLNEWEKILFGGKSNGSADSELSVRELVELMQTEGKTSSNGINESVKHTLEGELSSLEEVLKSARKLDKKSVVCTGQKKSINEWDEKEIKEWASEFKMSSRRDEIYAWNKSSSEVVIEVLSVLIRAVMIYDHYPTGPRNTQLMSLLMFLENRGKGRLGNVYTGEGKTLITVLLATCLALTGKRVDVVTSSKVLAVRDSKARTRDSRDGYKGFYAIFGLDVSNNCDEECENEHTGESERAKRYESAQIVYGETSFFQRDILLTQFFKKKIRSEGASDGNALILDEVDSMMIDNAAKTLYLSHNITDMRHLRDIFLNIWAAVNSQTERHFTDENVEKVLKYINQIIDAKSEKNSSPISIAIPNTLREFVTRNLKKWIESAYTAKHVEEDNTYIIGDGESQRQNEPIIMDKDTGVEQTSSKWGDGLHQFIQLKHCGRLSDESLKAVYMSNAGFFQSYDKLYGMTGTVGGNDERQLLAQVYEIDFFEMPRFKRYRFEYDFESESVAATVNEWLDNIVDNIDENMDQELTYSQEDIDSMGKKLKVELEFSKRLTDSEQNIESNRSRFCKEKEDYEKEKLMLANMFEIIEEVRLVCEKADLQTFGSRINVIINRANSLETVETRKSLLNKFKSLFGMAKRADVTENDIEDFGVKFRKETDELKLADLNSKYVQELEKLDVRIKQAEEEIDYVREAIKRSQSDIAVYKKECSCQVGCVRSDSCRAVLVICDSIADLKLIEERIRSEFSDPNKNRLFKYDRAYKKFDVSCLEAGDVVIATNIAGRGTDLLVSKLVEENGGLHVIMTYMPKNLRIEKQGFGRTARAGNRGTGTFILFDPRRLNDNTIDVLKLKNERDDEETRRLGVVQRQHLPKIKLEDELFVKFNDLQQTIESQLENKYASMNNSGWFGINGDNKSNDFVQLELASLKNHWAIWLNQVSDMLAKVHETGKSPVYNEFVSFKNTINKKLTSSKYGLIEEPGELNKLGRLYLDLNNYSEAIDVFNLVIEKHAEFASIAYYYKAFSVIELEKGGFEAKRKAKPALKSSLRLLEDERNRVLSRNQILKSINQMARSHGKSLDSDLFSRQNEDEARLLSVHINAIYSAIGSQVSSDCFNSAGIVGDQPERVYNELLNKHNLIKGFRLSKKIKIVTKSDGQREIYLGGKLVKFPETFEYCRERVLEKFAGLLDEPEKRQLEVDSFSEFIYTKEKFEKDTQELVKKEKMVRISSQIDKKLLGAQIDPVYCGKGNEVKRALLSKFVQIDKKVIEKNLNEIKSESVLFGKRSELVEMFASKIEDNRVYLQDEIIERIESIVGVDKRKDEVKLNSLIQQLGLNEAFTDQFLHEDLARILIDKTKLTRTQVDAIIEHLENYEKISIDHMFLEQRVREAKNESIFFVKKSEIREFCLGNRQIPIGDKVIELKNNETYDRENIVQALRTLTKQSTNVSDEEKSRFSALLIQLGFDTGLKLEAITSFRNYTLKNPESLAKIKDYLEVINLKEVVNSDDTIKTLERLDLGVAPPLEKKQAEILSILKSNLDKPMRKEDFKIKNDEEFLILRMILTDAKLIKSSLFSLLSGQNNDYEVSSNQELENILMHFYYEDGSISDKSVVVLKEARQGSEELFSRLLELRVIKQPKVRFELAKGKYYPEFLGGNAWKEVNDPAKQIEYIREKVEKVVYEVFKLERRSDGLHTFNEYVSGGIGTESKNKDLDEKIETITNIIKSLAGTLKTMPEVKLKQKDLRSMFADGNVPSELNQYIQMCFDKVLEYQESKGFDWDCFMCAMIGVAQIVAGVAIEVLSGGSAHLIAQTLIAEGIGDIIFAMQSVVEGNFSWKAYAQHKIQSLMISLLTMGVGAMLSRGAQSSKLAVGLATRTAITKAILKTVILEGASAVISAAVNIGSEEISKLIIEELASVHFVQFFEKWQSEDSANKQKLENIDNKLKEIYEKFGENVAKPNIDLCIEASLQDLTSGQIGNKIYAQIGKVVGGVLKGMSQAANRFKRGSSKAKILGNIVSVLSKTVQVAEYAKNFSQLCIIYNEYYDLVINRLERLEETLTEQKKNGSLKIDNVELAREKTRVSYSGKMKNHAKKLQEKAQVAFKLKVKNGLLQPAVSSLLYTAVNPIKTAMMEPLADAMNQLAKHIDERAEMFMEEIIKQTSDNVAKLTSSQKRALELRGEIIPVDELTKDSVLMKAEVANFPGDTIETLKNEHGSNLSIMVQDGQIFAVLPTYSQFCSSLECGGVKLAGKLHASMHATYSDRNIELVNVNDQNEIPDNAEKTTITPLDGASEKESFKIGFSKGKDGKVGHFSPVIVDEIGQKQIISLNQNKQTEGSCLTQSVMFLEAYEKELAKNGGNVNEAIQAARTVAEKPENVAKRNKTIGKSMKSNSELKNSYYQGTTVKSDRIVGGLKRQESELTKRTREKSAERIGNELNSQLDLSFDESMKKHTQDRRDYEDQLVGSLFELSVNDPENFKDMEVKRGAKVQNDIILKGTKHQIDKGGKKRPEALPSSTKMSVENIPGLTKVGQLKELDYAHPLGFDIAGLDPNKADPKVQEQVLQIQDMLGKGNLIPKGINVSIDAQYDNVQRERVREAMTRMKNGEFKSKEEAVNFVRSERSSKSFSPKSNSKYTSYYNP